MTVGLKGWSGLKCAEEFGEAGVDEGGAVGVGVVAGGGDPEDGEAGGGGPGAVVPHGGSGLVLLAADEEGGAINGVRKVGGHGVGEDAVAVAGQ